MRVIIICTNSTRTTCIRTVNPIVTHITETKAVETVTMQAAIVSTVIQVDVPHIIYTYMRSE